MARRWWIISFLSVANEWPFDTFSFGCTVRYNDWSKNAGGLLPRPTSSGSFRACENDDVKTKDTIKNMERILNSDYITAGGYAVILRASTSELGQNGPKQKGARISIRVDRVHRLVEKGFVDYALYFFDTLAIEWAGPDCLALSVAAMLDLPTCWATIELGGSSYAPACQRSEFQSKSLNFQFCFSFDSRRFLFFFWMVGSDEIKPPHRSVEKDGGSKAFIFEFRTNFTMKRRGEKLKSGIWRALGLCWAKTSILPERQQQTLRTLPWIIPVVVGLEVCTAQQDGEPVEAAMARAIRAQNVRASLVVLSAQLRQDKG
ncbi:mRNA-capping enzyme subunit alpha [Striga asiatica]|uniref:mRNA-capping enzyme subunit alpha n=1 Tax=Striga asiatica TaxID=4170 RepID=A0A5A7P7B5_STRAF|nr:mRNA-capping enzyme subunit alpha [Striga asiatica]